MTLDPEFLKLAAVLQIAVYRARELYPWPEYDEGSVESQMRLLRQALACASEAGELAAAVASFKGEGVLRINEEAIDVMVTAYRVLVRR